MRVNILRIYRGLGSLRHVSKSGSRLTSITSIAGHTSALSSLNQMNVHINMKSARSGGYVWWKLQTVAGNKRYGSCGLSTRYQADAWQVNTARCPVHYSDHFQNILLCTNQRNQCSCHCTCMYRMHPFKLHVLCKWKTYLKLLNKQISCSNVTHSSSCLAFTLSSLSNNTMFNHIR